MSQQTPPMLTWKPCTFLAKSFMALSADLSSYPHYSDLAEQIISKYLFPELANENDETIVPRTPHMHTETRQKLYSIIRLLCKRSDDNVVRIMQHLEGVIPRGLSHRIPPLDEATFSHFFFWQMNRTVRPGAMTAPR